jgi:S1-C subfamily serine protease
MAANILERLGTRTLPEYAPAPTPVHTTGPGLLQVYLGTIPDYSGKESRGLRLAGVRDGSPAALGGLRAEDVVLSIDDTAITDVYAYTYFLSGIAAGAELSIRVQRNGEQLTLTVIPESR